MPELPDLSVYLEHLEHRVVGARLLDVRLASPFLLRTVEPPLAAVIDQTCTECRRLGKQLVLGFTGDYHLVLHLMIAGRLQWRSSLAAIPKRVGLAAFDFTTGSLLFTEAAKKRRASLRVVQGAEALSALDPGGLEVFTADREALIRRLADSGHTVKRALTDQRVLAGIGNAYSDEILHRAGLSPFRHAGKLSREEMDRLVDAIHAVLDEWTRRLSEQAGGQWPKKVTAFHPEMAVHGRYRQPCPVCGTPVQRIVYAENEANYCPGCQTGGRVLADRSLSRLLKEGWPRRVEELE